MKLLIVTQKVDREDPILGFFHGWLEEFAKHYDHVTVIGQMVGSYALPENIDIVSLEKEKGKSTSLQIIRFWWLQWKLRGQYDAVLVHMTPIWIVLGSFSWLLLRKRMYLWYEARGKRWPLKISLLFVQKIFSASPSGVPFSTAKHRVMGHGIQTTFFSKKGSKDNKSIITVGRLTKAKRIEFLLQNFLHLPQDYQFKIVGGPLTDEDQYVEKAVHHLIASGNAQSRVSVQTLSQDALREQLQRAKLFIHASTTPMDKALLEAMSSGCLVLTTSDAFPNLPKECKSTDETFVEDMESLLHLPNKEQENIANALREIVIKHHSLPQLVQGLSTEMQ